MATFTKINDFVDDLGNGVHNFGTATIMIALTDTAPASEASDPTTDGNGVLANITQVAYTNYTDTMTVDRTCENVGWNTVSGTATLDCDDITITASGGSLTFRYVYIYNDSSASDSLIGVWDYGSSLALADGDSVKLDFGANAGTDGPVLTIS